MVLWLLACTAAPTGPWTVERAIAPAFNRVDTNHDGAIDADEWARVAWLGVSLAGADRDHSGEVELDELIELARTQDPTRYADAVADAASTAADGGGLPRPRMAAPRGDEAPGRPSGQTRPEGNGSGSQTSPGGNGPTGSAAQPPGAQASLPGEDGQGGMGESQRRETEGMGRSAPSGGGGARLPEPTSGQALLPEPTAGGGQLPDPQHRQPRPAGAAPPGPPPGPPPQPSPGAPAQASPGEPARASPAGSAPRTVAQADAGQGPAPESAAKAPGPPPSNSQGGARPTPHEQTTHRILRILVAEIAAANPTFIAPDEARIDDVGSEGSFNTPQARALLAELEAASVAAGIAFPRSLSADRMPALESPAETGPSE
jgi:hypothetical protein